MDGDSLQVVGNPLLSDISALGGIEAFSGALQVVDNPLLSHCALDGLAQTLGAACGCPSPFNVPGDRPTDPCSCDDACACTGNDNAAACP